jgi:hypothetical protein
MAVDDKIDSTFRAAYADVGDPALLAKEVAAIRSTSVSSGTLENENTDKSSITTPYWAFVYDAGIWATLNRYLNQGIDCDRWDVVPAEHERYAPGQLGIVLVGDDRRTARERSGAPLLEPGIYALFEVESEASVGALVQGQYWDVEIRYVRNYNARPVTIERLRSERPDVARRMLEGAQASSFPIEASDFYAVLELLREDINNLVIPLQVGNASADDLTSLQNKYIRASPEVKERVSKYIERGSVGRFVKKALGFKCQICDGLGRESLGFRMRNGELYVEAHHVMPVSVGKVGSLAASNVMVVCANHHRQLHYGEIGVMITETTFDLMIDNCDLKIPRLRIE